MDPKLAAKLDPLFKHKSWASLLEWLSQQEKGLLLGLKGAVGTNVETSALAAAEYSGAMQQIGRIKTLSLIVEETLAAETEENQ